MWRSQLGGVRSLWRSGAREPGWLIGGTLTAIGYAVIATSVIVRLFAIELGYFWQQDYGWMSRAAQADLSPRFLFDGVGGQPSVIGSLFTWTFVRVTPYDFALAGFVLAVLWAVALISVWRVLRRVWPDEPTMLLPLVVLAWGLISLPTTLWFSQAIWALPALIAAAWLGHLLLRERAEQPPVEFGAIAVYVVGLLCTPLFALTLLGLLALMIARTPDQPFLTAARAAIQRRTPFWLVTAALTVGYLLMLRANGAQWHPLGISGTALLSSFGSMASWPSVVVRAVVLAAAVWFTVRSGRARAVRSWGALAVVGLGCIAVSWLVGGVSLETVRDPLTYAPVLGIWVLALAMALASPRSPTSMQTLGSPQPSTSPPSTLPPGVQVQQRDRRLAPTARSQVIVLLLVNAVVLAGWLGSTGFLGYWRANDSRTWMVNAVDSLRGHPERVKLLDRETPQSVVGADAGIPALNSQLFAPGGLSALFAPIATDNGVLSEGSGGDPFAAGPWQGFNPSAGRLVPGRLDGSSFESPKCTPVTATGVTVKLNGSVPPGDNDIEVQTTAPTPGQVTIKLSGGEPVTLPTEGGQSTVFSRAFGGGTDIQVSSETPGLCVRKISVGRLVAASAPQ